MDNFYDVREKAVFAMKTGYAKIDGLAEIFEGFGIAPANPEYLVTVQKSDEEEGVYIFELYCGFEEYGDKTFVIGIQIAAGKETDIKLYAMQMVRDYTGIDWAGAVAYICTGACCR